ncbi:MAG: hypothetical protein HY015_03210 [Bacteroidetes bacterium]|nr:hypothetical protein [Bacteroidota bacterium]MBI3481975.1 hypothetical protein [Bacteroidota bacterium]
MKNLLFFSIVLILSLAACTYNSVGDKSTAPVNKVDTGLRIGGPKYEINPFLHVAFDSVLNDSRCPENADCIWVGNAALRFIFTNKEESIKFVLNTDLPPRDTVIEGYRVKLLKLTPPLRVNVFLKQSDYRAEISAEKE